MGAPPIIERHQLRSVEAARGIAALMVVLFHASTATVAAPQYWGRTPFGGIFDFGYAGVEFFFVLSGFIIAHVHARDIGMPGRFKRYALRRFVRIYPIYWLVLAGTLALALVPGLMHSAPPTKATIAASIALIGPDSRPTVMAVAWTLYHEVAFYIVFGLWLLDRRIGLVVSLVWTALAVTRVLHFGLPAWLPRYLTSEFNLLFLFGIAVWWFAARWRMPAPRLVMLAAALAFAGVGYRALVVHGWRESLEHLAFGGAAAVGLAAMVSAERSAVLTVPAPLVALGGASYALYLVHYALLALGAKLLVRAGLRSVVPANIAFVVLVLGAVAGGLAFHHWIESPLLARAQRALGLTSRRPV